MGIKIKKEKKPQAVKLTLLNVKYTLAVPLIGLIDIMTMISFYMNPATDGNMFAKGFYIFFALVGAGFAYWAFMWKLTSDNKRIIVSPVFGAKKEAAYSDIKKVEIHKKKRNKVMVHYSLHGADGKEIVKVYPIMKNCGELLERLKRMEIKIQELEDR